MAIDPTTGAASIVGPLNASGAFALAARGDGVFFTVTDSGFVANPDARLATQAGQAPVWPPFPDAAARARIARAARRATGQDKE